MVTRINPGDTIDGHLTGRVVLFQGVGDSRREIEWWSPATNGVDWVCPETVNGFWYGYDDAETASEF